MDNQNIVIKILIKIKHIIVRIVRIILPPFDVYVINRAARKTGNTIIKLYEGLSKMIFKELKGAFLSSLSSKIGAMLIKKSIKDTLRKFDASDKGGAPLLGLKGLVVKIHGNSKEGEVISAIDQCVTFVKTGVNERIVKGFENNES